jgi:hypothetical protein
VGGGAGGAGGSGGPGGVGGGGGGARDGGATAGAAGDARAADVGSGGDGRAFADAGARGDGGPDPATFTVRRGRLLFSDDFSSGSFRPAWQVVGGTWSVVDQRLAGSQPAGEADPNIGRAMAVDRVVIQFAFALRGTGRAGVRLNHRDPANPQHLVNVVAAPASVTLSEMSGWGGTTRSRRLAGAPVKLELGRWYTGVLEVYDSAVAFGIDGTMLVSGMTVDQSATPRNHFVLQALGDGVLYDDVRVWEALKP